MGQKYESMIRGRGFWPTISSLTIWKSIPLMGREILAEIVSELLASVRLESLLGSNFGCIPPFHPKFKDPA